MLTTLSLSLLACLPLFGPQVGTAAQEPDRQPAGGVEREASALERWLRMSNERRELLRSRFKELRRLTPEERAVLEERHRGVKSMRERIDGRLSPEARRELRELAPEQRYAVLREELVEEARVRGARIREKLPREFARELELAAPDERPRLLDEFRREQFQRRGERRLNHLARQLGLPDVERERIAALPPREHRRELSRLEKQRIVNRSDTQGAPPRGIEGAAWERLRQLPPEAFLDEMLRRGVSDGSREAPRAGAREREGASAVPAWKQLRELLRPDVTERIKFGRLSHGERARHMRERVSNRAFDFLERESFVEPAELERLRGLSGPERMRALRELGRGRVERGEHPRGPRQPARPRAPGARPELGRHERPGDHPRDGFGRGAEQRRQATTHGGNEPR